MHVTHRPMVMHACDKYEMTESKEKIVALRSQVSVVSGDSSSHGDQPCVQ